MADKEPTDQAGDAASAPADAGGEARPVELIRALAALGEPPAPEHARVAEALDLGAPPDGAAYARLLLMEVHPYASVHLGADGMLGGEARERVAGFWRAVGRTPPPEPDHLSALLVLHASLLEEAEGQGPYGGDPARRALAGRSAQALFHEHLGPWAFMFLDRVRELGGTFYAAWAALLEDVLRAEGERAGAPTALPGQLASAPSLPDPRTEGGDAFVAGLLAPVRTGMIVTASDLIMVAHDLGLGGRVAERRRVLADMLSQDAPGVLEILAAEASARAEAHEEREPMLGTTATFWARRARTTAGLLRELAEDAGPALQGEPAGGTS